MSFPFPLPITPGALIEPVWTSAGFMIGKQPQKVLTYSQNDAGWDDELTSFHEESATANHPIDVASRNRAVSQVKQFCNQEKPVILEVGCSSGYLLRDLQHTFSKAFIIGADVIPDKLEKLAEEMPTIPLMQFDLTKCPLPDNSIDVLIMLNVLEHIEDDNEALMQAKRILKPGGILVLEIPAGPHLYDIYDKFLRHFRRYNLSGLTNQLQGIGYKVENKSHLGMFPYPMFYLIKKKNQKLLKLSEVEQEKIVANEIQQSAKSPMLKLVMKLELMLGRLIPYWCGIRCVVTCRK